MPHRTVHELMMELLYGDTPAGWRIIGPKENIKKITVKEMRDYRTLQYIPKKTAVIVSGDINEKKVIAQIKKYFDSMPSGKILPKQKVIESQKSPQVRIKYKKTDQAHLVIGFRTFDMFNKENPILSVLTGVLAGGMSSRLFQKIREEMGVGYYVRAENDAYTDHGYLDISAGVAPDRISEVIRAILDECKRLMKEPVPKDELNKTKEYLIGMMQLGLESSDDLAQFYGMQELLRRKKIESPEAVAKKIRAIKAPDIMRMAKKIFTDKGLNLAIIGPFEDLAPFTKDLHL